MVGSAFREPQTFGQHLFKIRSLLPRYFGRVTKIIECFRGRHSESERRLIRLTLVDVSDIFYFFCSGEGKGELEAQGAGEGSVFIENPRRGVSRER